MFKAIPFFQKHFRKCGIPAYIHQQSVFPSGWLGSTSQGSSSSTISHQTDFDASTNFPCSTSRQFNSSSCTNTGKEEQQHQPCQSHLEVVDCLFDILRSLQKITLVRTRTAKKTVGFLHDSGIVVTEFEVSNEHEVKIFDVQVQQGDLLEEFSITIFDFNSDTLLCTMHLESDLEIKGLVLKISLPHKNHAIGSVIEVKGMSKTTFIKNKENELIYQVFTHRGLGGFGWTSSAKILNPEGNEKLGDFQINKPQGQDLLSITINLPKTKESEVLNKMLILGCCLILIKDH